MNFDPGWDMEICKKTGQAIVSCDIFKGSIVYTHSISSMIVYSYYLIPQDILILSL